jgi:hypothetical protein
VANDHVDAFPPSRACDLLASGVYEVWFPRKPLSPLTLHFGGAVAAPDPEKIVENR